MKRDNLFALFCIAIVFATAIVGELHARPRPVRRAVVATGRVVVHGTVKVGRGVKVVGRVLLPPYSRVAHRRGCR